MDVRAAGKAVLRNIYWEEGRIITYEGDAPYRYRIAIHCSSYGRQIAAFVNGTFPYFCYIEIVNAKEEWVAKGAGIVPVLPDGRFIMIVEQRPLQERFPYLQMMIAQIGGRNVDLRTFGPFSSLEFPGGGVEPSEGLKAGFIRELAEETGVEEQTALCYRRGYSIYPFGSDIACANHIAVAFLSGLSYQEHVATDGGLTVFALTRDEIVRNIRSGVIRSGQAALLQWGFYREVEEAFVDPRLEQELIECGYLIKERVKIVKA